MARARAWLSLQAARIVFATAHLIQQSRSLTYARHVLVESRTDPRLPMDTLHVLSVFCMRDIAIASGIGVSVCVQVCEVATNREMIVKVSFGDKKG